MLFNSYPFMIFFPIILLIYFLVPKKIRYIVLLVGSYYFYMCWNVKYVILILFSTVITYLAGLCIEKTQYKKSAMTASIVLNLAVLAFFKYFDFAIDSINSLLKGAGVSIINNPFDIILPVGISFYTFQALGYTIDVYRGNMKAEKNFLRYALFVSFFPQLVAGPIERSGSLLTQLNNADKINVWNFKRICSGAYMMLWGYFLKMMIADRLSILVDNIFDDYLAQGTIILLMGAVAFSLQIYCDFASYSAIAIGAAKIMGFTLMENFDTPYFAMSIKEFWRRWHISLSTWFRDYLYIPLGGNRKGKVRKYINLMITFLASGLWHGANWTFVFWGGLHGLYQIIGDLCLPIREKICKIFSVKTDTFSHKAMRIFATFMLTLFAWIFFRAESIGQGFTYVGRIFTKWDPWVIFDSSVFAFGLEQVEMFILFVSLLVVFVISVIQYEKKIRFDEMLLKQNGWFQFLIFYCLVMVIIVFGKYGSFEDANAFLYFQF